jgi:halimadienyl-diphosphate synthase
MDINAEIKQLLNEIGPGRMSSTAYDTSWVARLVDEDELSNNALLWLSENQLSDGSWGAAEPYNYHDRVISTLAAMIALTYRGRRLHDKAQIDKGLLALENITSGATSGLAADPKGATAGFEMIVPTLVAEAESKGIIRQQGDRILGKLGKLRQAKMEQLRGRKINRNISPAFSAEMAGDDWHNLLDVDNLQELDGSVSHSPSATAYFAQRLRPHDPRAMEYLRKWASPTGGLPNFAPIDIFEIAWSLWNLRLLKSFDIYSPQVRKKVDLLRRAWEPGHGIGTASVCTIKDGDDTSMVFEVLSTYGVPVDIEAVMHYEEPTHFRCFSFEANPSISTNIHVLGALKTSGLPGSDPRVRKVLAFLKQNLKDSAFLYDKWHASPYYATAHMLIACVAYDQELCTNACRWILKEQRSDGAWGCHGQPTAEETAYCIQALAIWQQHGGDLPEGRLELAANWLKKHLHDACPPLWIGKALYTPHLVVRAAILSALALVESR